jgi:hypothetical protein
LNTREGGSRDSGGAEQAAEKSLQPVILSEDFMILRLTTVHENDSPPY